MTAENSPQQQWDLITALAKHCPTTTGKRLEVERQIWKALHNVTRLSLSSPPKSACFMRLKFDLMSSWHNNYLQHSKLFISYPAKSWYALLIRWLHRKWDEWGVGQVPFTGRDIQQEPHSLKVLPPTQKHAKGTPMTHACSHVLSHSHTHTMYVNPTATLLN